MNPNFQAAKELIDQASNILITTHERTDGDDLGTALALANHLIKSNKRIELVISGGVPSQLFFLPGSELVKEALPENFTPDLIILSGCSKIERANLPQLANFNSSTINFDHHPDNTNFASINVVEPTKSAVAELMYDFFNFCNWEITPNIATCLLTGIFTDTGSFMHSNTSQLTLRAAANLQKKGASINKIAKFTYRNKNEPTLKAWSKALENTYYDDKKQIIYSVMTEADLIDLNNIPISAFEGFVETLNKVPEAKVALFLKQDGETIKGSLRSDPFKGVNVQKIAHSLGGGGHKWAAGFSVIGKLVKDTTGRWELDPKIEASI